MGDAQVQHAYEVYTSSQLDVPALYDVYGFLPVNEQQMQNGYYYRFQGLTDETAREIGKLPQVVKIQEEIQPQGKQDISYYPDIQKSIEAQQMVPSKKINYSSTIFPHNKAWNIDWYGPIRIPKKGDVITVTPETLPEYEKLIVKHEGNTLENKNGQI